MDRKSLKFLDIKTNSSLNSLGGNSNTQSEQMTKGNKKKMLPDLSSTDKKTAFRPRNLGSNFDPVLESRTTGRKSVLYSVFLFLTLLLPHPPSVLSIHMVHVYLHCKLSLSSVFV